MKKQMIRHAKQLVAVAWMGLAPSVFGVDAQEKLWDAKADFVAAERKLDEQYVKARKELSDADFDVLKIEQELWSAYREYSSVEEVRMELRGTPKDGEESVPMYWEMMAKITKDRILTVKAWRDKPDHDHRSGYYIDNYGGKMMVVQKDDKLHFVMEAVRGVTRHSDRIFGVAAIDGQTAQYGDKAKVDGESMTFTYDGRRLKVSASNIAQSRGSLVDFDGEYMRIGALTAEQANAVLKGRASPYGIDGDASPFVEGQ